MERAALSRDAGDERLRTATREPGGPEGAHGALLALQRSAGNRAVAQALGVARKKPGSGTTKTKTKAKKKLGTPTTPHVNFKPTRVRVPPNAVGREDTWTGPTYGPSTATAGGTSVRVDLGPAAGQPTNYGSKPATGACTAVNALNGAAFGNYAWIKGHLLNDNLGGPGISSNLTPMTHNANMDYKNAVESKVKNAITLCYSNGQGKGDHWYGVHFEADTMGTQWAGNALPAAAGVAQNVNSFCSYIKKPRAGGPVTPATATPFTGALPLPGVVSTNCVR